MHLWHSRQTNDTVDGAAANLVATINAITVDNTQVTELPSTNMNNANIVENNTIPANLPIIAPVAQHIVDATPNNRCMVDLDNSIK